jgi:hypothetical protein
VYTRVVSRSKRTKAVAGRRAAGGTRSVILNCRSRARRPRAGDTILSPERQLCPTNDYALNDKISLGEVDMSLLALSWIVAGRRVCQI